MGKIEIQDMGEYASKAFAGEDKSKAVQETYAETEKLFADEIRKRLSQNEKYSLADLGSFKGELLSQLVSDLSEYDFETIAVDVNKNALDDNLAYTKVIADATRLPFKDKSVDVEIVRFLLQWNTWENQQIILREIARTTRKFALIEHAGSDNHDPADWRERIVRLFSGDILKLKRSNYFFSSREEIELSMKESGINFERIREKNIQNLTDVYAERYNLGSSDRSKAKEILGNKDFFVQTDWVILP